MPSVIWPKDGNNSSSIVNFRVSSVLNKDVKQFGKKYLFDGKDDTCWNSDQGTPQWILLELSAPVQLEEIKIQFQGGFCGRECWIEGSLDSLTSLQKFAEFYPEDNNTFQSFAVNNNTSVKIIKIVFNTSSDFFGRIIVYRVDLLGSYLNAVILSCGEKSPKDLIHQILKCDLPDAKIIMEKIHAYRWHVETKYYTCDINLCTLEEKTLGNLEFAESVQAVVIYFDSESESSFSKVQEWMVFVDEFSPEVRVLVCENCSEDNNVKREKIQQWCLKNAFELVELEPKIEPDNDTEDDFMETTGIQRIIQALQAHLWPNLEMKEQSNLAASKFGQMLQNNSSPEKHDAANAETKTLEQAFGDLSTTTKDENSAASSASLSDDYFAEAILSSMDVTKLASCDAEASQSFESLFQHFQQMKDKATHLPPDERKAYAEKVVLAFWEAMGGDDEEVAGLDDN